MAECAFHPGTETNVRCVECDRYICTKDMVPTPVGYKCKECSKQLPSARRTVKPKQLALATLAAAAMGIGGSFVLAFVGVYFWFAAIVLGIATGEAARRASGGHRSAPIGTVAGSSVLIGATLAGLGPVMAIVGTVAAIFYVTQNRW